jgi:hypothetical protein
MLTRIICDICGGILREGDIGAGTERKTCINCVCANVPKADLNKIKHMNSQIMTPSAAQMELETIKKRMSRLNVEMPYKEIEGKWHLVIELKDYYGRTFAEFALDKGKLAEFIKDIQDIENTKSLKK